MKFLFILFCFFIVKTNAQDTKLVNEISHVISRSGGFGGPTREVFLRLPTEEQSLMFTILISINKLGNIEKVEFTNKSDRQDSILVYDKMVAFIKADKNGVFKNYKQHLIIAPVWIRKLDGHTLKITPRFLNAFDGLIPVGEKRIDKVTLVLPPLRYNITDPIID